MRQTAEGRIDAFRSEQNRSFKAQGLASAKKLRLERGWIDGEKLIEGGDLVAHGDWGVKGSRGGSFNYSPMGHNGEYSRNSLPYEVLYR